MNKITENKRVIYNWFKNFKGNSKCEECGEKCYVCIELHHLYGKDGNISEMVHKGICSKNQLKEEIKKCEVVCSNCHKKIHAKLIKDRLHKE